MFRFTSGLVNRVIASTISIVRQQRYSILSRPAINYTPKATALVESSSSTFSNPWLGSIYRFMNRNARRPKRANHGKRPVCNARRRAKRDRITSRAHKTKIFGFW